GGLAGTPLRAAARAGAARRHGHVMTVTGQPAATASGPSSSSGRRVRGDAASGRWQITDVPAPGEDFIFTSPPWSSTKERTSARPSPAPRVAPEEELSDTLHCRPGALPLPLSDTARRMMFSLGTGLLASILMCQPAPVKRSALVSRLNITCLMRRSSA